MQVFPNNFGFRMVGAKPTSHLYRSRDLACLNEAELAALRTQGIELIIDLRKPSEIASLPTPDGLWAESISFGRDSASATRSMGTTRWPTAYVKGYGKPGERMIQQYKELAHQDSLHALVIHMICAKNTSTLIHCANGKDRVGVFCAQLLKIAGADDDEILDDYLLTNEVNSAMNAVDLAEHAKHCTREELEVIRSLFEAREAYLMAFFSEIDLLYGSFAKYCDQALHLSAGDREVLTQLLGRTG